MVAGWVLCTLGRIFVVTVDTVEDGASQFLKILGRLDARKVHQTPKELIEFEFKLTSIDEEKEKLLSYVPRVYTPGPLEQVTYQEELPKLHRTLSPSTSEVRFEVIPLGRCDSIRIRFDHFFEEKR